MYAPPDTAGETLSLMIKDVLTRLSLPVSNLRCQMYDGTANMASQYRGCQAFLVDENPLALYIHCSTHCANLVAEAVLAL